jgi:hypothetical protein
MCDLATLLLKGFVACSQVTGLPRSPPPRAVDYKAYDKCLEVEAETVAKKYGSGGPLFEEHNQEAERITAKCTAQFGGSPYQSSPNPALNNTPAWEAISRETDKLWRAEADRRNEAQRKQAELDAPRLKAKFDAATQKYRTCLFVNVRDLALASTEPAEVVSQAPFAACGEERTMVENDMVMDVADRILTGKLLLEVIKVRDAPRSPSK